MFEREPDNGEILFVAVCNGGGRHVGKWPGLSTDEEEFETVLTIKDRENFVSPTHHELTNFEVEDDCRDECERSRSEPLELEDAPVPFIQNSAPSSFESVLEVTAALKEKAVELTRSISSAFQKQQQNRAQGNDKHLENETSASNLDIDREELDELNLKTLDFFIELSKATTKLRDPITAADLNSILQIDQNVLDYFTEQLQNSTKLLQLQHSESESCLTTADKEEICERLHLMLISPESTKALSGPDNLAYSEGQTTETKQLTSKYALDSYKAGSTSFTPEAVSHVVSEVVSDEVKSEEQVVKSDNNVETPQTSEEQVVKSDVKVATPQTSDNDSISETGSLDQNKSKKSMDLPSTSEIVLKVSGNDKKKSSSKISNILSSKLRKTKNKKKEGKEEISDKAKHIRKTESLIEATSLGSSGQDLAIPSSSGVGKEASFSKSSRSDDSDFDYSLEQELAILVHDSLAKVAYKSFRRYQKSQFNTVREGQKAAVDAEEWWW